MALEVIHTKKIGLSTREAAWTVLRSVSSGAYADVALERIFIKNKFSSVDRGFITELVYGAIRHRKYLDSWIDFLGKYKAKKQPPLFRWLLHIGLYQILFMEKVPDSAAVNTSVELAKIVNLSPLCPVLNGILRSCIRFKDQGKIPPVPKKDSERIAQMHSLPQWIVDNLIVWKGIKYAENVAKSYNISPPIDLRINRLCSTRIQIIKSFTKSGIPAESIKDLDYGINIPTGFGDLKEWPGYQLGHWSVQNRSSQRIAPLLAPDPGERILDACAAPGGKATHLAEMMNNQGEIWAVDKSLSRLKLLENNANRLGISILKTLAADSSMLLQTNPEWVGYFHKILLDAPCSGLGTLARNPDARWRISPENIAQLIKIQRRLLDNLLPLLMPGGRLVYSTCTIHPEENSQQIDNFLSTYKKLELVESNQIFPDSEGFSDGFFSAVLELKK